MNWQIETLELPLEAPFTIARGTTTATENVVLALEHDGETAATVEAILPDLLEAVEAVGDPHARREIHDRMLAVARGNPAAPRRLCAVSQRQAPGRGPASA